LMEGPPHNHPPAPPVVGIQPRAWDRRWSILRPQLRGMRYNLRFADDVAGLGPLVTQA
jgi:hypothetical protein